MDAIDKKAEALVIVKNVENPLKSSFIITVDDLDAKNECNEWFEQKLKWKIGNPKPKCLRNHMVTIFTPMPTI